MTIPIALHSNVGTGTSRHHIFVTKAIPQLSQEDHLRLQKVVVVTQLVEQSLQTPEVRNSNLVSANSDIEHLFTCYQLY